MNQQLTYSILTDLRSKCRQLSHRRSKIAFGLSIFFGSGLRLVLTGVGSGVFGYFENYG
jgi:hypothetical protein